jgi:hypothetical protein
VVTVGWVVKPNRTVELPEMLGYDSTYACFGN